MPPTNRFQAVLEAVQRAGGGVWSEGITRAAVGASQRYDLAQSHYVDDNEKLWSPDFRDETALAFISRILENACARVHLFHEAAHPDTTCQCAEIEGIILGILNPKEEVTP